jgi:hypothetical protein
MYVEKTEKLGAGLFLKALLKAQKKDKKNCILAIR